MKNKLKSFLLLIIFSLSITAQVVSAATEVTVDSMKEAYIEFNRAVSDQETDITITFSKEIKKDDITKDIEELFGWDASLYGYSDSDYGYFNMNQISYGPDWPIIHGEVLLKWKYYIEYRETKEQTKWVYDTIHQLIRNNPQIIKASDYDKAAWIYDYITSHVVYDYSFTKYTAYHALYDQAAVCQGYSLLFYAMATELGLNCKIVPGIGNGGPHAWNLVELEGKWYYVDSTWGAGGWGRTYFLRAKDRQYDTTSA